MLIRIVNTYYNYTNYNLFMLFGKGEYDNILNKYSVIPSDNRHVIKSKFFKLIEAGLF